MNKALALLFVLIPVGALTIAFFWWQSEGGSPWTTRSPEALEAFESGLDAMMKEYRPEAREAFERAIELDQEFWTAKLFLSYYKRGRNLKDLQEQLTPERLAKLTPRERLLFNLSFGLREGRDREELQLMIDTFLERRPDDTFALLEKCYLAWQDDDWEAAEACYLRLLEKQPNWVLAQERLGSIALAQGRFQEAEEHFRTYLFVAPEQANPYSSLGRLLALRGRYEEAEAALQQGIEIKSDFCQLYVDLAWSRIFAGQFIQAEQALDRLMAIPNCAEEKRRYVCTVETLIDLLEDDLDGAQTRVDRGCLELNQGFYPAAHRLAVLSGRIADAERMEGYLEQWIKKHDKKKYETQAMRAVLAHAEGVRLLYTEQPNEAAQRFRLADELLPFWGSENSTLKLFNRLNLAYSLRVADRPEEAKQAYEEIRQVNPDFAKADLSDLERVIRDHQEGG